MPRTVDSEYDTYTARQKCMLLALHPLLSAKRIPVYGIAEISMRHVFAVFGAAKPENIVTLLINFFYCRLFFTSYHAIFFGYLHAFDAMWCCNGGGISVRFGAPF
jgi:hypothetical protein